MADVFPRRNLPPDAEQWGRTLETTTANNSQSIEVLAQSAQAQNRNTASSLEVLAQQITSLSAQQEELQSQQAELEAQQVALSSQQAALTGTINFLSTQTSYDQKLGTSGGSRGGVSGIAYESLDGAYDCALTVTTAGSGKLLISVGAAVTSSGAGAGVGPEIVGVSLPDFTDSATAGENGVVGASRTIVATLSPNTTYIIYTRRWWYGSAPQFASYQAASLVVTRLA